MTLASSWRVSGGTALDRDGSVRFQFNGRSFTGLHGDTLASALLANGVRVVGRSFKFHRPRGILSCGFEEPNALVQLGTGAQAVPAARATVLKLREGLEAFAPGGWPSLDFDLGRVFDLAAPLWAAGFYNKSFMWPSWHAYEGLVRRMAGFGHVPSGSDPDRYDTQNLHCDVLIVGGGVAGLKAARTAADQGSRVVLVEHRTSFDGQALWDGSLVDAETGPNWVTRTVEELALSGRRHTRIQRTLACVRSPEGPLRHSL
jgi:sarcosine oxidase subunit alpha